ncbi:hypothetical protein [Amycolatopsis taiwanensis]|uniref:Uncharacterized protein n=1 Tax=Amycolatopsis taiwanensis TaxID=342230 RepID=A0A9W6VFD4_9PSEU|nr:hypothetical protein [Amycolatopsis taiwanensis]GLY64401.1 hypothetical protein Atai01_10200 [Amycolatopsis taiwanensis]
MRRRNDTDSGGGRPATRSAGTLPLVAAVASALALTGAAFYTVDRAGCAEPGQYVRHGNRIELVGGCVDASTLSGVATPPPHQPGQNPDNYRP